MLKTKITFLGTIYILLMVAVGCNSKAQYSESKSIPNQEWKQNFKTVFKIPINDTTQLYDIVLTLRTTSDFPYRNLWMYLTIDGPAGKSRKLPLNIITADPSGRWTGDKSGSVVTFDTLLVNHNRFPKKGQYTFSFEQATTQKNLPEVLDLTLDLYSDKK